MSVVKIDNEELLAQLNEQLNDKLDNNLWNGNTLDIEAGQWKITLDRHHIYTRMYASFVNLNHFHFTIHHRHEHFLHLKEFIHSLKETKLKLDDPTFNDKYVTKSNDNNKLIELLDDPTIRLLLMAEHKIHVNVRQSNEHYLFHHSDDNDNSKLSTNVSELHLNIFHFVKDIDQLKELFYLFVAILERLQQIGEIDAND
ncbi:unnamed protein product [Didymodactylos carnosus]|uniref:Uncharacterized protein n=1 Tax=Didymodactylos carnosus TaxID=1234261 RepID=A0A814Q190_9BILA|nr:unnamed protein product [Didymodactylos carnosus]CAF1541957.1 unnamed protein product [Didymodactylos carnosus]CAF3877448.1 unnamed protein product [Didymodactylos carnosus]CAF4330452.1 unnamed protein product [Didymodactylos carnosus]